jgi:hypothetical protein
MLETEYHMILSSTVLRYFSADKENVDIKRIVMLFSTASFLHFFQVCTHACADKCFLVPCLLKLGNTGKPEQCPKNNAPPKVSSTPAQIYARLHALLPESAHSSF